MDTPMWVVAKRCLATTAEQAFSSPYFSEKLAQEIAANYNLYVDVGYVYVVKVF